ncbi:hypothetical protein KIPB_005713, partial [Kipferlia bialata]
EHMIAAGAWDWGWLIMLGIEILLFATFFLLYQTLFDDTVEDEEYETPQWFFGILMFSSAIFAVESALRFYLMYVSLSLQHEYWQAPRSTHMYYGPYMIAALGSAVIAVVYLFVAVLGGITQFYPIVDIDIVLKQKRNRWFTNNGIRGVNLVAPVDQNAVEGVQAVHRHPPDTEGPPCVCGEVNTYSSSESGSESGDGEGVVVDVEGYLSLHGVVANVVEDVEVEGERECVVEKERVTGSERDVEVEGEREREGEEDEDRPWCWLDTLSQRQAREREAREREERERERPGHMDLELEALLELEMDIEELEARFGPDMARPYHMAGAMREAVGLTGDIQRNGIRDGSPSSSSSRSASPIPGNAADMAARIGRPSISQQELRGARRQLRRDVDTDDSSGASGSERERERERREEEMLRVVEGLASDEDSWTSSEDSSSF